MVTRPLATCSRMPWLVTCLASAVGLVKGPVWQGFASLVKPFFFFFGFSSTNSSTGGAEAVLVNRLAKWLPCESMFLGAWRRSREKPLFLAPSHPKALWEHVFRGFIGGAVSFYPVWQKTAPNGSWSRWRSPAKRGLKYVWYVVSSLLKIKYYSPSRSKNVIHTSA